MVEALSFKAVESFITNRILEGIDEEVFDIRKELTKLVRTENKKFFKILVQKGFGKSSTPNLGRFTPKPKWEPLSDNYTEFKRQHGLGKGFFNKTGVLRDIMLGMNPDDILGLPEAFANRSGVAGDPFVAAFSFTKGGKTFNQAKFIKGSPGSRGGQFASPADILRNFKASISISPIPKLRGVGTVLGETRILEGFNASIIKFNNPRGQRLRPLLANFMEWWIKVHILNKVNSRLSR